MEGEERMLSGGDQCGVRETILNGESSVGSGSIEGWGDQWGQGGGCPPAARELPDLRTVRGRDGRRAGGGWVGKDTHLHLLLRFFFLFPSSFS